MWSYVPEGLPAGAGLVVVLHGCKQNASATITAPGGRRWPTSSASRCSIPSSRLPTILNACFNWFVPEDTKRGYGEAQSIHQMAEAMVLRHGIDPRRVFVTGLSAGGAMTSVMLATYPDVFAGRSDHCRTALGCAANVQEALDACSRDAAVPGANGAISCAEPRRHKGPWPKISVWHGSADTTVKPMNADEIVKQWADVHGVTPRPEEHQVDGFPSGSGARLTGAPSWNPIRSRACRTERRSPPGPERAASEPRVRLLDVGISSSYRIAQSWGLVGGAAPCRNVKGRADRPEVRAGRTVAVLEGEVLTDRLRVARGAGSSGRGVPHKEAHSPTFDVGTTIKNAFGPRG